jgi:hypothetical protein
MCNSNKTKERIMSALLDIPANKLMSLRLVFKVGRKQKWTDLKEALRKLFILERLFNLTTRI